jgi:hypothetical protein
MYLWDTKALANELKAGTLKQSEKFRYFLIFVMVGYMEIDLAIYLNEPYTLNDLITSTVITIFTGIAIYLCYRINREGDDLEFLERYICLTLPVSIRFIAVILMIFIGVLTLSAFLGDSFDLWVEEGSLLEWIVILLMEIIYFWRIWVAIKLTAHPLKDINKIDATA